MTVMTRGQLVLQKLQEDAYRRTYGKSAQAVAEEQLSQWSAIYPKTMANVLREASTRESPERIAEIQQGLINEQQNILSLDVPTPSQSRFTYYLLSTLAKDIEETALKVGRPIPLRPIIGSLPTNSVNARAIFVPGNEYIVVFEEQLFDFANLFAKVAARVVPYTEDLDGKVWFSASQKEIPNILTSNPEISQRFREVVLAYILKGKPSEAPQYILKSPYDIVSALLRESMELFIMGHEYGHVIQEHLVPNKSGTASSAGKETELLDRKWEQESLADADGLMLMFHTMLRKGHNFDELTICYAGASLFFSCVEIIGQGVAIIKTGEENVQSADSHPPPGIRRELQIKLLQETDFFPSDFGKRALEYENLLHNAIDLLWRQTKPYLYEYHKNGGKVPSMWT